MERSAGSTCTCTGSYQRDTGTEKLAMGMKNKEGRRGEGGRKGTTDCTCNRAVTHRSSGGEGGKVPPG